MNNSSASPIKSASRLKPLTSVFDSALKYAWRHFGIRDRVIDLRYYRRLREWRRVRHSTTKTAGPPHRILILPSDPLLLTSSSGDQAMIGAIQSTLREQSANACFFAATAGPLAERAAQERGITPLPILSPSCTFTEAMKALESNTIGTVVAMGADVLDGSYNVEFSGRQLMLLDLFSRMGAECFITGFSVSKHFRPEIVDLFNDLDPSIQINLRDPVSFSRFTASTRACAKLVADVAFLLTPRSTHNTAQIQAWIQSQRQAGRLVVGLNCHPLLLELTERHKGSEFNSALTQLLGDLLEQKAVALLFIDHDSRGDSSDDRCLKPIHEALQPRHNERLYYPDFRLAADEVKEVAGMLDAVVSGRMHLMIASMGAGTPVFGIDYKDKMEGLLRHFEMPTNDLSSAADILSDYKREGQRVRQFLDEIAQKKLQVAKFKSIVRAAAKATFEKPGKVHTNEAAS